MLYHPQQSSLLKILKIVAILVFWQVVTGCLPYTTLLSPDSKLMSIPPQPFTLLLLSPSPAKPPSADRTGNSPRASASCQKPDWCSGRLQEGFEGFEEKEEVPSSVNDLQESVSPGDVLQLEVSLPLRASSSSVSCGAEKLKPIISVYKDKK